MNETVSIRKVSWAESREDLLRVRRAVFVVEQGVPESIEVDEHDEVSTHFLAVSKDAAPVGTARLLASGKVGRVAVLREFRRQGIGERLMRAAISYWLNDMEEKTPLLLHAQVSSIPFYESLGFLPVGDEFREAEIPHRKMILLPENATGLARISHTLS